MREETVYLEKPKEPKNKELVTQLLKESRYITPESLSEKSEIKGYEIQYLNIYESPEFRGECF